MQTNLAKMGVYQAIETTEKVTRNGQSRETCKIANDRRYFVTILSTLVHRCPV